MPKKRIFKYCIICILTAASVFCFYTWHNQVLETEKQKLQTIIEHNKSALQYEKNKLEYANKLVNDYQKLEARNQYSEDQIKAYLLKNEHTEKNIPLFNINNIVQIENHDDIKEKRKNIINYIWKNKGFPHNLQPNKVEENYADKVYIQNENIENVTRLTFNMEHGVNSYVYFYKNKQPQNCLAIYHRGHGTDYHFYQAAEPITNDFLNLGCDTLLISMPLLGVNNQPQINIKHLGPITLKTHNDFAFLENESFSPISYFMNPITGSINYANQHHNYTKIVMAGLSGGGWSTVLYSALDERIQKSYSIAGSMPIYIRNSQNESGDYEQLVPSLYKIANYLELYIMTTSNKRSHIQVVNRFDDCCFSGTAFKTYIDFVANKALSMGGRYFLMLDETLIRHVVSQQARKLLKQDIQNTFNPQNTL